MTIQDILNKAGTNEFKVQFKKKNGEIRDMRCQLGVTEHLKGGELKYDPAERGYLIVYDLDKKNYRTVNLNALNFIKLGRTKYEVEYY